MYKNLFIITNCYSCGIIRGRFGSTRKSHSRGVAPCYRCLVINFLCHLHHRLSFSVPEFPSFTSLRLHLICHNGICNKLHFRMVVEKEKKEKGRRMEWPRKAWKLPLSLIINRIDRINCRALFLLFLFATPKTLFLPIYQHFPSFASLPLP